MKSGWFWGTARWEQYQRHYFADRPRTEEYKSSPLDDGYRFEWMTRPDLFDLSQHHTQVLDLTLSQWELWRGIRKSYRPLINKAMRDYTFSAGTLDEYHRLHVLDSGRETRSQGTWDCMAEWIANGFGGLVLASRGAEIVAGAYFIIYHGAAYYASGASIVKSVQHAVIWTAMKRLKDKGVCLLELGQLDGETEKEQNIGVFKHGFGGETKHYTVARRII